MGKTLIKVKIKKERAAYYTLTPNLQERVLGICLFAYNLLMRFDNFVILVLFDEDSENLVDIK